MILKNLKYLLFVLLFSACSSQQGIAQIDGSKKAQEIYKVANDHLVFGRYAEATKAFEKAVEFDPEYINAHLQLANIYQNLYQEYENAILHYQAVIKLDPSLYKAYYEIGQCYFSIQDFDEAEKYAKDYRDNAELSENGKWQASLLVESIAFARNAVQNKVIYEPINLGPNVNSEKAEYFPSITADNKFLYFTVNDESSRYPNEDIYLAEFKDGEWQERIPVLGVNSHASQEGAHSITQDGRYLFFASDRDLNNLGRFDLYIAKKIGDQWKSPVNIGNVVNTRHWESQPVISADSKELYLVRKSADGLGGSDIYVCTMMPSGGFGAPVNLGTPINTPGDEQRPYLHPDGKTLYFASNGHPGMGSADVFKSIRQDDGSWSKPVNLGFPLNSNETEYGLYVAADGKSAYISSDREGGYGDMDIYSFVLPDNARPQLITRVQGNIKDANTLKSLKADIKIVELETGKVYKTLSSDEIDGTFLITLPRGKNYVYQANVTGYLPYSENFTVEDEANDELITLEALMQKIEKGKEFVLENIFFETNAYELKENSKTELYILIDYLNAYPELFLEIGGHTDSDGSEGANLVLSEKRAKSVYDFLINEGVQSSRITFKGYGESQAIYPNDSVENKAKNRRTAFKVL